jgi:hypothetical protein
MRFPSTPPAEEAIQTYDWSSPEEDGFELLEEEVSCFPTSATIASLATSAIEAPRLLSRRYRVMVKIEKLDGERSAIASHETACNKAAATNLCH